MRQLIPDDEGPHPPAAIPENVFKLLGVSWLFPETQYAGPIYLRCRQVPAIYSGFWFLAFGTLADARQCPPMPFVPEQRPEMFAYRVTAPTCREYCKVTALIPNLPHHPEFPQLTCAYTGYGKPGGFEAVYSWLVAEPKAGGTDAARTNGGGMNFTVWGEPNIMEENIIWAKVERDPETGAITGIEVKRNSVTPPVSLRIPANITAIESET